MITSVNVNKEYREYKEGEFRYITEVVIYFDDYRAVRFYQYFFEPIFWLNSGAEEPVTMWEIGHRSDEKLDKILNENFERIATSLMPYASHEKQIDINVYACLGELLECCGMLSSWES